MNYELYIPIYGNYLQVERLLSEEEESRPFPERALDAVFSGSVSGIIFGISVQIAPSPTNVWVAQQMVRGLSAIPTVAPLAVPAVLAAANFAVIESAPEEQRPGLYQMFSSGLTGTWGGDYSGLI